MVDMGMSQHDFLRRGPHLVQGVQYALDLATRIDDSSLAGIRALDDGTILLVRRYRNDGALKSHTDIIRHFALARGRRQDTTGLPRGLGLAPGHPARIMDAHSSPLKSSREPV
jgi:hypothetical protein